MVREADYLIVGQGLAGSALAWELLRRGRSVVVFDQPAGNKSSSAAAGLFNPLATRIMGKSWLADQLFPFLTTYYQEAEAALRTKFFYPMPIYRPFMSAEEKTSYSKDLPVAFGCSLVDTPFDEGEVINPYGGLLTTSCGYLDARVWIAAVREYLRKSGHYVETAFDARVLEADAGGVRWRDFRAKRIVFCEGVHVQSNPWFSWLPVRPLKGETLEIKTSRHLDKIYSRGVYVVPFKPGLTYLVGSTFERPPFATDVTTGAEEKLSAGLRHLVPWEFQVVHQEWGIRPTSPDRRPMLGAHPENKNIIAFNGLGTKGVSLSPYFAHQLVRWMEAEGDLLAEVNINRFKALYSELL